MEVTVVSDLHGFYPQTEGGDLLIIAGDLTAHGNLYEYDKFHDWARTQDYDKVIVIAGNHDGFLMANPFYFSIDDEGFCYLCDSGTEFEGLKIWGSPYTKRFAGMNPRCMAFTVDTDEELAEKWALIPSDTDILITHSPPYGILDEVRTDSKWNKGSKSLINRVQEVKPMLHCFGHLHECGGKQDDLVFYENMSGSRMCVMVNASHVNENYEPVNKPIRIKL